MIGSLAYQFITSTYGRYIMLALTIFAAIVGYGRINRRRGKKEARADMIEDVRIRTERGRDAYYENQRTIDGLDSRAIADRLRKRDDVWRRLRDIR